MIKELFKRANRKGMGAERAKSKLKIMGFAFVLVFAVCSLSIGAMIESDNVGIENVVFAGSGALIAIGAIAIPDEWKTKYSEQEYEGMADILNVLNNTIEKSLNDPNSKLDIEKLKSQLDSQIEGFEKEKEAIKKALDKQAEVIERIKGTGNPNSLVDQTVHQSFIKKEFDAKFDEMTKFFKENKGLRGQKDFTIVPRMKAIDEHDPTKIEMTTNITRSGVAGFDWLIDSWTTSPTLFRKRRPIEFIRDILSITRVENVPEAHIWEEEGNEVGAFAVVAENAVKPQIFLDIVKYVVRPQKVAGHIVVTEEVLKWRSRTWARVLELFRTKFEREYNRLLAGIFDGVAVAYPSTALDGTIAAPTDIDAIGAAALAVENLNFVPDTIIINPADKWRILLSTNNNGTYIFLPFIQNGEEPQLLGFRLITSNYVDPGTFYIGEAGSIFVEEETPSLRAGLVNDDLIHNRMTLVLENYFLAWQPNVNEGAWIKGDFDDIKDALQV